MKNGLLITLVGVGLVGFFVLASFASIYGALIGFALTLLAGTAAGIVSTAASGQ
jgi:hypothetical protein